MPPMRSRQLRPCRILRPAIQELEKLRLLAVSGGTLIPTGLVPPGGFGPSLVHPGGAHFLPGVDSAGFHRANASSRLESLLAKVPASPSAGTGGLITALGSTPTAASLLKSDRPSPHRSWIRPMTLSSASALRGLAGSLAPGSPAPSAVSQAVALVTGTAVDGGSTSTDSGATPADGGSSVTAVGSGAGTDPGTGGSTGTLVAFSGTVTVTDDGGDSISESVMSGPTADGGFYLTVTLTDSYGDQPSATTSGGDITTNGGSASLAITFNVTPSSLVATEVEDDSDTFNDSQTLSGLTGSGTWKASGQDKFHEDENITLNADGSGSVTEANNSTSTDKYDLSLTTTTGDGHVITDHDSGKDKLTSDETGNLDTQGNDSENLTSDVNSQETNTVDDSGGGLEEGGTETDTVDFGDQGSDLNGVYNNVATITDVENDSAYYDDSGTLNDGASFNVSDAQVGKFNGTDTTTSGSAVATTEEVVTDGTQADTFNLSLANVNDGGTSGSGSSGTGSGSSTGSSSGSGAGSSSGSSGLGTSDNAIEVNTTTDTTHEDDTTTYDASGNPVTAVQTDETSTFSDSDTGTDIGGPFSATGTTTTTTTATGIEQGGGFTPTGGSTTVSPPNEVITGSPPYYSQAAPEMAADMTEITTNDDEASVPLDPAAVIATMTIAQANPPAPTPPTGTPLPPGEAVKNQDDFYAALQDLQDNWSFANRQVSPNWATI